MTAIAIAAIALTLNVLTAQQGSAYLFMTLTGWFVTAFLFIFLGYVLLTVLWTTKHIRSRSRSVVEASKKATADIFDFAIMTGDAKVDGHISVDKSKELPMMEFPTSYFRRFFAALWSASLIVWLWEIVVLSADFAVGLSLILVEISGAILYGVLLYKNR